MIKIYRVERVTTTKSIFIIYMLLNRWNLMLSLSKNSNIYRMPFLVLNIILSFLWWHKFIMQLKFNAI